MGDVGWNPYVDGPPCLLTYARLTSLVIAVPLGEQLKEKAVKTLMPMKWSSRTSLLIVDPSARGGFHVLEAVQLQATTTV